MEWWQVVIMIAAVVAALVTAFVEIYIRFLPEYRGRKKEGKDVKVEVEKAVSEAMKKAQEYKRLSVTQLHELIQDRRTPAKSHTKLIELVHLGKEYDNWRYESWRVVRGDILQAMDSHRDLAKSLALFNIPERLFYGMEDTPGESLYKDIYNGDLTFDLAKELALRDKWDARLKPHGEDKELVLRELVEGRDFHGLIDMLRRLPPSESLKMLREARAGFLEKAKAILDEVS